MHAHKARDVPTQAHGIEGFDKEDVQAAITIDKHLLESDIANDWA
jgi:hypothetical protein